MKLSPGIAAVTAVAASVWLPIFTATVSALRASSPRILSPANGSVFAAGSDFATDVLQDPWDFSNVEDLSPYPDEYPFWTTSNQVPIAGPGVFLNAGVFSGITVNY